MYLSFGATLEPIGIVCYSTVWSVGVPTIINEGVLCLCAHKMQRLAKDRCLHTFFFLFGNKGEDRAAPSELLWTLQLQLSRVDSPTRPTQQQFSSAP